MKDDLAGGKLPSGDFGDLKEALCPKCACNGSEKAGFFKIRRFVP